MKKIFVILLILFVTGCGCEKQNELKEKNIEVNEKAFSIGDNGTEIEIELKNEEDTTVEKIVATLYDSENNKIGTIEYNEKTHLKKNEKKGIKISSKEKYSSAATIKYKVY